MTHDEALEILRTTIVTLSSLPDARVVRAYTAQVPQLRVGHLHLTPLFDVGVGRAFREGGDMVQHRRLTAQIDALGLDACAALRQVHLLLWPASETLPAGTAIQDVGDLADTTTVDRTAYVPRLTFRVDLGYVALATYAPGPLATAIVLTVDPLGSGVDEIDPVASIPIP